mgnify:FL=1
MLSENRNCECNMQDEVTTVQERKIDCNRKEELLSEIQCHEFAINELALYLDTHPEDQRALCLHRKYCNELKPMKDMYQRVYGPLTINYPCNKWRWLEEPWPWEGGGC